MSILYKGMKWYRESIEFKKVHKEIKYQFNNNEKYIIKRFEETGHSGYLQMFYCLVGDYSSMAISYYIENPAAKEVIKYTYLSGMAALLEHFLYQKGIREEYVYAHMMSDMNYELFKLVATDEMSSPYLSIVKDNLIMLMYQQKYEEAEKILRDLPDNPKGEGCEWDYYAPSYLKPIYMAIINHDEKGFNAGLEKRIKKYRTNMVGYSVIVDVVSVALIKMAKKAGINCTVDVIEIPKQFFSEEKLIDTNECKLPYFDELLKSGLL